MPLLEKLAKADELERKKILVKLLVRDAPQANSTALTLNEDDARSLLTRGDGKMPRGERRDTASKVS